MKKQLAIAAVLSALLLTACTGGNSPDTVSDSSQSEASGTPESSAPDTGEAAPDTIPETAEPVPTTEPLFPPLDPSAIEGVEGLDELYGPDGEKVDKSGITNISYGYDDEGNEDRTKWMTASFYGFAYYCEPQSISYNSVDNSDLFDAENWGFGVDTELEAEYKKCAVGDTVCGLTVTEAFSQFGTINADSNYLLSSDNTVKGSELGIPEIYFMGSSIKLEGSVDMTGYIFICPEDEGYDSRGDIFFTPDPESCILPVVKFGFDHEKGISSRMYTITHDGSFFSMTEYPNIYAGNINSSELDFTGYPIGEPIKVALTADNISMSSTIDWLTQVFITITDINKLG